MSNNQEQGHQEPGNELLALRKQIDRLDQSLVLLLANRFALTRKVGEIKARAQLESFDPKREAQKLVDIRDACTRHELNPDMMADILAQIMRETVSNHERIKAEIARSIASG
ncbi:chorismate mutase [Pseudohongiella sp.]|uniref:Chorismate mutase domain-containing protein n=1 Tax=marine sediment metagenome TaxID=412755 RepID=A0A0F9YQD6_9ZZZZ|nr:chorismate mutase [Pseudohongiella sp.]HDZ10097.1 chorismate mutase [Pseudohongiella sp.]HEA63446.1 chorismate mutase [Pseudohongiella sp.]